MSSLSISGYFPFARVKVVGQSIHLDCQPSGTLIRLEPDRRFRPVCHDCGGPGTIHSGNLRRIIRDLNMACAQTQLQVDYRRVWCQACGTARVEHMEFADPGKRITHRLARYVYDLCKVMTVQDVARHLDLDPKTVKEVDKHFLQQEFGQTNCDGLRILAVDEIAFSCGLVGYMTVVLDYLSGRVVWVGQGRVRQTLDGFFALMTEAQKQAIEAVAMDCWEAYINSVQLNCPQAKIVFDFFHIVKGYSMAIDNVRRNEYRRASEDQRRFIKGSRYLLLRNRENLQPQQQVKLDELLAANKRLNAAYILKDQLKEIYSYSDRRLAKEALDQWCALAAEINESSIARFIGRLQRFEDGILNHCDYPISTGRLEGVNNKIKVIKRRAYGFHDHAYFALKVKQAFPGHPPTTLSG